MASGYQVIERLPTLAEYEEICTAVGWAPVMNFAVAQTALARSLYGVVIAHDGKVVGMGRIVGDGAIYFYIQDVAVLPEHQRRGVGTLLLDQLMAYLGANAPEQAFVGIFAADGTIPFYSRYGFRQYPALTGIFLVTPMSGS